MKIPVAIVMNNLLFMRFAITSRDDPEKTLFSSNQNLKLNFT
jgi:hypothetical protein